jgi:Family of unknown function (DUF6644)
MYDPSTNFLNVHEWAYGLTEVVHILSLAIGVGLIAVVDLRVLGIGPVQATPERLLRSTAVGTVIGLVLAITSGLLIASTDPIRYFNHPTMQLKLLLVVIGLIFNYTIHSRVLRQASAPAAARVVAVMSLFVWTSAVFGGIFYAFT